MRRLAIASGAFSAAVFVSCYLLPAVWLLPLAVVGLLGGTALFDPEGERLCALGEEAGILYAALHDNVEQIRAGFSAQTDARFPLYAKLYQNIQ